MFFKVYELHSLNVKMYQWLDAIMYVLLLTFTDIHISAILKDGARKKILFSYLERSRLFPYFKTYIIIC